eukprot:12888218-Prorocentrum_lima.AAC.1
MADRHHAVLSHTFLKARASPEAEGLNFDPQQLLTKAVVANNCLTTLGQHAPIQATLGYQPALLPDLGRGDAHCDGNADVNE